jgi:uncharacterized protein (TIRG00374 family)
MTTTARPSPRVSWQALVIVALTVGLLWLFFRGQDFGLIWLALTKAHPGLIGLAVLTTVQTYVLRAWRWQALLAPLGRARFRTAFRSTVIGFTATFLLPGRIGEILKPYLLARQEGFKVPATFATVVVERLLDLVTVLFLFACALPFAGVTVGPEVTWAGAVAGAGALTALLILFLCAGHPERLGRWAGKLTAWLPERIASAADNLVRTLAEGLAVMRRPAALVAAAAWSIPLWLSIALGIWLTSAAFDLTFSFAGSFLVTMFLAVGVSAPTPGGVGGFHYFYKLAVTQFFGANPETATAAALVLHAVSFVPVTIVGLIYMGQDGLTLGGLKKMAPAAERAEGL